MQISRRAQQHCCSTSSSSSAVLAPQPARPLRCAAALPQRAQHRCTADCPPSSTSEQAATSSRRTALLSLAAAAAAALALPRQASAKALGVAEAGLAEYAANEQSGKFPKDLKALESFRSKYKFRRAADGRVSVQGSRGDWYSVRVDMEVAGAILLRNAKGYIYALQIDGLKQIDLSDDYIVLLLFADGDWEKSMTAVEYNDEAGKTTHLKLDETEYRNVVGLLNEVVSEGEEQQQQQ